MQTILAELFLSLNHWIWLSLEKSFLKERIWQFLGKTYSFLGILATLILDAFQHLPTHLYCKRGGKLCQSLLNHVVILTWLSCMQTSKCAWIAAYSLLFQRGGIPVKKDGRVPIVHCFFTEEGEKLPELVRRSLRLFIERNLRNAAEIWRYGREIL